MRTRFILCFPLCASLLLGQGESSGLANLKLPSHAREASLASGTVADPTSFSSFLINPALLQYSSSPEFAVSHQQWIEDVQSEFLAAAFPLSFGVIGVSLSSTSVAGIELRDQPGPPLGTFSSRYGVLGLSGAASLFDNVQAGMTLKYLYEKIYVDEAVGWGLDLGLASQTGIEGLSLAGSIRNIGTMSALRTASTQLPTTLTGGGAFQTLFDESIAACVVASLSRELAISSTHLSAGIEVTYSRLVMLRLGYASGFSARGFSAGFGFVSLPLLFDYSFTPFSQSLGSAHFVSLGVRL